MKFLDIVYMALKWAGAIFILWIWWMIDKVIERMPLKIVVIILLSIVFIVGYETIVDNIPHSEKAEEIMEERGKGSSVENETDGYLIYYEDIVTT